MAKRSNSLSYSVIYTNVCFNKVIFGPAIDLLWSTTHTISMGTRVGNNLRSLADAWTVTSPCIVDSWWASCPPNSSVVEASRMGSDRSFNEPRRVTETRATSRSSSDGTTYIEKTTKMAQRSIAWWISRYQRGANNSSCLVDCAEYSSQEHSALKSIDASCQHRQVIVIIDTSTEFKSSMSSDWMKSGLNDS